MVKDKRTDSQMLENYPVQTQKIYNIVPTTQKNITMQKVTVNNNNNNNGQRLQTVTSVNSLQRGTVSASAGNPLKLHVVNSKSNLALKTPLQVIFCF